MSKPKNTQNTKIDEAQNEVPNFFTLNRIKRFIGLSIIFFSIFTFIALISYCFNWKEDQGNIVDPAWKIFFSQQANVHNIMGRLGAYISHVLIYTLFGVGAFLVPYFPFALGVNITFSKRIFKTIKIALNLAFGLTLIPLFGIYLFPHAEFSVGGGMGNMLYLWLSTLLGRLGLGLLLFGGLVAYLLLRFRHSIYAAWLKYRENAEMRRQEKIEMESIIPEEKEAVVPHFNDPQFDILNTTEKEKGFLSEEDEKVEELTHYEEPDNTTFEIKTIGNTQDEVVKTLPISDDNDFELSTETKKKVSKTSSEELTFEVEQPIEEKEIAVQSAGPDCEHGIMCKYQFPPIDILVEHGDGGISIDKEDLEDKKNQIVSTLLNYNINIEKIKATVGPTVTLYEIVPSAGIRISKIKNLEDDIALSLAALGIRIIAPIPGKGTIGIEVPNIKKAVVSMKSMIASEKFQNSDMDLPIAIGKTISNEYYVTDLSKMPHLLMAGATGQGKSVGLNAILVSLLYKKNPTELKFVLIDPKKVELSLYKKIEKYYLARIPNEDEAIITDTKKVINTLNALCIEMDQRYDLLKSAMVRNIKEYNSKFNSYHLNPLNGHKFLPYIVLIIDEFADLMMTAGKEIEMPIARLAQLARAVGIHLVIATQRPSVNIITGIIKANFPGRIAFKVASKIDSRTILDTGGAEQLIGRGDLLLSLNSDIIRLQCAFVDTPEIEEIASFIENQILPSDTYELPEYIDPKEKGSDGFDEDFLSDRDPMFEDAARLIVLNQVGSTSLIQRKMSLGYNRSGRLMDQLEAANIVGPNQGSRAREVYVKSSEELEQILRGLK
ncbi:MAG: DNA translocase FtsK [Chitinophagales bacterium]|nr:DNA translocase FtsK [Chitinophagales bacterium]MCZ2393740.1 DNA translocase FtsK [Chitinophagales bacterium]